LLYAWLFLPSANLLALVMVLTRGIVFKKSEAEDEEANESVSEVFRSWSLGEISISIVFLVVVVLWISPGFLKVFLGPNAAATHWFKSHLHESIVAIFGAVALFIVPGDIHPYKPVLTWKEAQDIDWGTILLFGGGLSLGHLMLTTGLGKAVGAWLISKTGATTLIEITILSTVTAKVLTELVSNTATANMLIPVAYSLAIGLHVDPVPPMVGTALGAGLAFLLPVSTPPNAVAYGTGRIKLIDMFKWGLIMDVAALIFIVLHLILLIKTGFFAGLSGAS
jgi:sodium-dependent dicarboxylate transporter 2/3/5